jgi:hypothetical protein
MSMSLAIVVLTRAVPAVNIPSTRIPAFSPAALRHKFFPSQTKPRPNFLLPDMS